MIRCLGALHMGRREAVGGVGNRWRSGTVGIEQLGVHGNEGKWLVDWAESGRWACMAGGPTLLWWAGPADFFSK
jgi:hypothetical protein